MIDKLVYIICKKLFQVPSPPWQCHGGLGSMIPPHAAKKFLAAWSGVIVLTRIKYILFYLNVYLVVTLLLKTNKYLYIINTDLYILHLILDIKYDTYDHAYILIVNDEIMLQYSPPAKKHVFWLGACEII